MFELRDKIEGVGVRVPVAQREDRTPR
jgi:hypothetical protein